MSDFHVTAVHLSQQVSAYRRMAEFNSEWLVYNSNHNGHPAVLSAGHVSN
jgi:hypothetical protein